MAVVNVLIPGIPSNTTMQGSPVNLNSFVIFTISTFQPTRFSSLGLGSALLFSMGHTSLTSLMV